MISYPVHREKKKKKKGNEGKLETELTRKKRTRVGYEKKRKTKPVHHTHNIRVVPEAATPFVGCDAVHYQTGQLLLIDTNTVVGDNHVMQHECITKHTDGHHAMTTPSGCNQNG